MSPLTNEEFFKKLDALFSYRKNKDHGSIYLTQKRLTYVPTTAAVADLEPPASLFGDHSQALKPAPILIRATNGKGKEKRAAKEKISTIVEPHALEVFYARYAEVCKAGMTNLKPRDRTKRKAKAKSKKKVGGAGLTTMSAVP